MIWGNTEQGRGNIPLNLTTVIQIAVTDNAVAALQKNGTIVAWGNNDSGETDVPLILKNNATYITGGNSHFVALTRYGDIVAWGDNSLGQCDIPEHGGKVIRISTGGYHTLALTENGVAFAWGWNWMGQCNIPKTAADLWSGAGGSGARTRRCSGNTIKPFFLSSGEHNIRDTLNKTQPQVLPVFPVAHR